MKTIHLFTFFLFSISSLSAQYQIQGQLTDADGQIIEFANIVLYQAEGDKLIKGVTTDVDGKFAIIDISEGNYYLKALMLGYNDFKSENFQLNADQPDFSISPKLEEEANTLNEVEVVAKVPLLEQRADRMVVNVAKSLTAVNGSMMDIMKKVPGMLVVNGKLSMPGSGSPTILIDGRSTQYMDMQSLLREMPGDNIEKIEVIHQPGSEYEASGTGPIINIILKKNKLYGTNGSVRFGIGKANRWRYNTGINLNIRQGKLNITGGGGYSYNTYDEQLEVDRIQDGVRYISYNDTPYDPKTYRGNIGLDYYLTEKQTIGIGFRATGSKNDRVNLNITDIDFGNSTPLTKLETMNNLTRNWEYYRTNAYYAIELDTMGQKLEVDGNYATFSRDATSLVTTTDKTGGNVSFNDVRNTQPGDTKIYTAKIDYTKPLNKQVQLQFGGKFSRAELDNDLRSANFINNEWVNNPFQSNHYIFDENIAAAYTKLSFSTSEWEGTFGLRYEDSHSEGYSVELDSTNTRDIRKLFPSASIARNITKQLALSLAYSYRIERPQFHSLNPFIRYMDPYTLEKGNTRLQPELTHSTKLSLSYEKQPFFSLEYSRTSDIITLITQQESEGVTAAFDDNLDAYTKVGGSLFFPLDFIPGVSGFGGFMLFNEKYEDATRMESQYNSQRWSFTSFIQANFKLPGDIKTELGGWYTSGGQDGIIRFEPMFGVSAGFERSFFDNKLNLALSIDDIVNRWFYGKLDYDEFKADIVSKWNRQVVSLRATYKFGNQFMKKKDRRKNGAQEEVNRASEGN